MIPQDQIVTTIHINVLGRLWMGGQAAMTYTLDDRKIKRQESPIVVAGDLWIPESMTEVEAVEQWLSTNAGDFSEIVAFSAVKSERASIPQHVQDDGFDVTTVYTRETVLQTFTDEEFMMFSDSYGEGF